MKSRNRKGSIGRRLVLGAAAAALSAGALESVRALGRTKEQAAKGEETAPQATRDPRTRFFKV